MSRGYKVTTTADHPFYVRGEGWTAVKSLKPGDQLVEPTGATAVVDAATAAGRTATVYNFEVESVHDYYVQVGTQWVLVHNDCEGDLPDFARLPDEPSRTELWTETRQVTSDPLERIPARQKAGDPMGKLTWRQKVLVAARTVFRVFDDFG